MGYVPDWTRQNMKKTGSSGPTTKESRKDCGPLFHSAPVHQNKSESKPMYLADGDTEETHKARGLEASSGDNVGLLERLRMGNIDQPGSEAYNRFGAGRGREVEAETTRLANRASSAAASREAEPVAAADSSDEKSETYGRDSVRSTPVGVGSSRPATSSASTPSRPTTRRGATSSVSGVSTSAESMRNYKPRSYDSGPDESAAESNRLARTPVRASSAPKYETSYDRMNRRNAEAAAAKSSREAERATLRENVRNGTSGEIDPKTLLPKR